MEKTGGEEKRREREKGVREEERRGQESKLTVLSGQGSGEGERTAEKHADINVSSNNYTFVVRILGQGFLYTRANYFL